MTYLVLVVLLLILLTVLVLWYVVKVARKRAAAQAVGAAEVALRRSVSNLRWSFASAIAHIEANLASRWRRYRIPWIMLLGDVGAGKSTLIENSGIDRAFKVAGGSVQHVGVGWNYFNRGVVLDVAGEYLGAGAGGGDQAWQTLLHLTEKYRPQRPVDGVVVTISASELLAAGPSAMEDLAHKGEVMHRRLWQAQNRFGIRFPVYVVITQCDRIAGFSSFARALPQHLRDGMLGWSNPYDFETGFQSEWATQGVDAIAQDIFATQAELLAAGRIAEDPDAFILFPAALAATREALRAYLEQLFRPSAYHETFYFRGIYLTGDAGPAAKAEAAAATAPTAELLVPSQESTRTEPAMLSGATGREPVFIKDLFERKVFAEFGLARASREALATRNRTVRILRWSSALLGMGWALSLVVATFQLDAKIKVYTEALDVMVATTRERAVAHQRGEHLPVAWYARNTGALLEKLGPLGGVRLWWFSMPGSWPGVTTLHGDIQRILFRGLQDIVFAYVRKGINVKVSELTGLARHDITTEIEGDPAQCVAPNVASQSEAPPMTVAIEDMPEFVRLREQVLGMETLEKNLVTFDGLLREGSGGVEDLRSLLRYTWRMDLPAGIDGGGGYLATAMQRQFTFKEKNPHDIFNAAAACAFGQGLDLLSSRFFAQNQVLLLGDTIAARIAALSDTAGNAVQEDDPYRELLRQIDALDALLKNPRGRWLATGDHDLGAPFDELLQHVAGVSAIGPKVSQDARTKTQAEIEKLRKSLERPAAEAVGPIVRRSAEGAWAIAPDVAGFQSVLATLVKQRFMLDAEGRRLEVRVDPGTVVRWDLKRLDEALALTEEQRRYLKDNLGKFPAMLQEDIRIIADTHLARRLTDLVAKAETIGADAPRTRDSTPGSDASMDANDFDRAGPQLVRLLAILKEVGADSTYEDLASLLKRDAVRGLIAINRTLDAGEFYTVRDGNFSWWQGAKNPTLGAFRHADSQGLTEMLSQQYGQVEWLAKLSAPLLAVVESAGMRLDADTARVVKRLRAIVREVDRFKNKNPRSSVAELEAFIGKELTEIDGQNCIEKMAPRLGAVRDADFFLERQVYLRQQLYARCVELVTDDATKAYATIRESFGRTIAGRFPFSQQPERGLGGEADPEDVVQFLRLYDRYAKSMLPILQPRIPIPGTGANVSRFLDQLDRVRAFLGPLVPGDDGAPPAGYELAIEFRVNQRAEIDGNKIVDWSIEAGNQTVRLRDANHQFRWRPGMPITLTLRWAKDATTTPVNNGALTYLSVEGKNVIYRFTDPWSLVSMLKLHAAGPVDALSRLEVRPHTLKFEFATQPVPAEGQFRSNLPESLARVFMRLTVTPGGKKDILSLPVFPTQAPGLAPETGAGPQRLRGGDNTARDTNRLAGHPCRNAHERGNGSAGAGGFAAAVCGGESRKGGHSVIESGVASELAVFAAPIPGESPSGVSLRYENVFQHIAEARREDDPSLPQGTWERPLKRADWDQVVQLCSEALTKRSKDIQIAAWLTEAWLHRAGLDGFARGIALIESLCREYWDDIHPRVEDGEIEYRIAPFVWINDNLAFALRLTVPIAEGASDLGEDRLTLADWDDALRLENLGRKNAAAAKSAEEGGKVTRAAFMTSVSLTPAAFFGDLLRQVETCTDSVAGLEKLMQQKLGDETPGLGRIREVLQAMEKAVREFGGERVAAPAKSEAKREPAQSPGADAPPARNSTEEKEMAEDRSMETPSLAKAGPIRSREEAYRRLAEAADYLLRTEPHSPTPYLVMRAVAWGNMPLGELLHELVQNEGDLRQLHKLLGMRDDG